MAQLLKVRDWRKHFENNRTRELKQMHWVPIPNKLDGDGYTQLIDHPDGAAHFGAWVALVEVASKCDPRGTLARDNGKPHDSVSLSRMTRMPAAVFDAAVPRLLTIGWLESEVFDSVAVTPIPQEGAGIPQDPARNEGNEGREDPHALSAGADAGNGNAPTGISPEGLGFLEPTDAPKTKTRGKGKAPAKPEHGTFKSNFTEGWNRRYGATYAWVHGKDDAHAKWILDQPDVARDAHKAKVIIDAFLANDDPWIVQRRHALGLLKSGFNRFAIPLTPAPDGNGFVRTPFTEEDAKLIGAPWPPPGGAP